MFQTDHKIYFKDSSQIDVENNSVDLIVTSPPYPMIEMWDESLYGDLNNLKNGEILHAYYHMHEVLFKTWRECERVLKEGGIACINIGDACRTIDKNFFYFPNHSTITENFIKLGLQCLPPIMWRKPSNKPNKFMGSGMLPPSAYVTLEQEYILIFRKGKKRVFSPKEKELRKKSAFFWEERNIWFSDCWQNILGTKQKIKEDDNDKQLRERNAAYPIEIPIRLINMFSLYKDLILDPFWGTGTTSIAAMLCGRNSVGCEIIPEFSNIFEKKLKNLTEISKTIIKNRLKLHSDFVEKRIKDKKEFKHYNKKHNTKVITSQEKEIEFFKLKNVEKISNERYVAEHLGVGE